MKFRSIILLIMATVFSFYSAMSTMYILLVAAGTFGGTLGLYERIIPEWILFFFLFPEPKLVTKLVFFPILTVLSFILFAVFEGWKKSLLLILACLCCVILGATLTFLPYGGVIGFYNRPAFETECENGKDGDFSKENACLRLQRMESFF